MSIDRRLGQNLMDEAGRIQVPSGDIDAVIARGRRRARTGMALTVTASVAVLAIGVLAGLSSFDPQVAGPPAGPDTSTPATVDATPDTTLPPTSTAPSITAPPAGAPNATIAGVDGIRVVRAGELVESIEVGPIMLAVDDLSGGFVFQIGMSASSIMWLEAGATDPIELIPAGPDVILRLHEVVEIDGSPTIVYTRRTGGVEPESVTEELRLRGLDHGSDTLVARVGGYESGAARISFGGDTFVVTMNAEGYTWFEFIGDGADGLHNPRSEAEAAEEFLVWVGHGVQSPDGATMAFLRGSPRSEAPFHLVVVELDSGTEVMSVSIEGARESTVTRVDWDGTTALVSIADQPAVLVEAGAVRGRLGSSGVADLNG